MNTKQKPTENIRKIDIINRINEAYDFKNRGQLSEALVLADGIESVLPQDAELIVAFGRMCLDLGDTVRAITYHEKAVSLNPDNGTYLNFLGFAYLNAKRYVAALPVLTRAVELIPQDPEVLVNLSVAYIGLAEYEKATDVLEKAKKIKPSMPQIYANLVISLSQTDRYEEALECAKKALKLDPKDYNAQVSVGNTMLELGMAAEAISYFQKAISLKKTLGNAYNGLALAKKYSEKDAATIRKTEQILKGSMPAEDRSGIHFALGKMYDDCGQWEKAFEHYEKANLLQKTPYEQKPPIKIFRTIKKIFTPSVVRDSNTHGSNSNTPVFIVGMPRSGTTLVEQIVASHPLAAGAGELLEIGKIAEFILSGTDMKKSREKHEKGLNSSELSRQAERYLSVSRRNRESATRVTDKMPDNYIYLGLIHLLFPESTILHVTRHPLDVCLSCYFQPFTSIDWSFDLKWIANRYRFYRDMMEYWEKTLPAGRITTISYEQLVDNPEVEAKRIIESCGIPWDDKCLSYKGSARGVRTASVWQVRQGVYSSSKKRWENYAPHLSIVAELLKDYLPDDEKHLEELGIRIKKGWGLTRLFGKS